PATDAEVKHKDSEWLDRPDYDSNVWVPDGVDRDRARLARAQTVVRSNPVWFAGVMCRRAASMLRYHDTLGSGAGGEISRVPLVSVEPPFGSAGARTIEGAPVWTVTAAALRDESTRLAAQVEAVCSPGDSVLEIIGDQSSFGDQLCTQPIRIQPDTDY